ncbi:unnamed protein product [Symbiodinium natans]|uniref:Uncharacterized protein n=1 Tax=Symbiodinium natans TaxID=878477 RepID=A0A812JK26_9DINO|nr:unnamed protein product [Symbiodinium natans]
MGCGASAAKVQPTTQLRQKGPFGVIPAYDDLSAAMQQQAISDGPSTRVKKAAMPKAACQHPAQLRFEGTIFSPEDEDEGSKLDWSSMDSSTWTTRCAKGAPMQPDRRSHERHLRVLDQFRRAVEGASMEFIQVVEARR